MAAKNEPLAPNIEEIFSSSLLRAILPICPIDGTKNLMMATEFTNSKNWQSLLIIGQSQVQRNGLLFQVSAQFDYVDSGNFGLKISTHRLHLLMPPWKNKSCM